MKNTFKQCVLALTLVAGLIPSNARAADRLLTVGHDVLEGLFTVAANDVFLVDLVANHSYSCDAVPVDAASDFDWSTTVTGVTSGTADITAREAGTMTPPITGETGDSADNRITLIPVTTDRYRLTVSSAKSGGELARIRCWDTTLYGGFNTNVNDFNFLEITNVSNATISGRLYAITSDGTNAINGTTFSVAANRRLDIDLHTPAGADKYGLVIVAHDGPNDALKGYVSQYLGPVSNFLLTEAVPLVPIVQAP